MKKFNRKGFTMVELLIVLAIIAILAAVAIPVYSSQLESSRKKVDESNLRAATGLAAQDYMLHLNIDHLGNTNIQGARRYIVVGLIDEGDKVDSKNMMVFPSTALVYQDGTYDWLHRDGRLPNGGTTPPTGKNVAFRVKHFGSSGVTEGGNGSAPGWYGNGPIGEDYYSHNASYKINGKKVIMYPLQQNGGNARFDIEIGRGGTVLNSKIYADKKQYLTEKDKPKS